jgi:hypothetical protein
MRFYCAGENSSGCCGGSYFLGLEKRRAVFVPRKNSAGCEDDDCATNSDKLIYGESGKVFLWRTMSSISDGGGGARRSEKQVHVSIVEER